MICLAWRAADDMHGTEVSRRLQGNLLNHRPFQSHSLIHRLTVVEERAPASVSKPPSTGARPTLRSVRESAQAEEMPYVYIVECSDLTYYVGSTWNLELRIHQHNSDRDGAAYTRVRRPVRLVWSAWFDSIAEAFAFEKRVQDGGGRSEWR